MVFAGGLALTIDWTALCVWWSTCSTQNLDTFEATNGLNIARAVGSSSDVNVVEGEIWATIISTKNIVIFGFRLSSTANVGHGDVLDDDTIGGFSGWTSVEVILLDVDTIDRDVRDLDIVIFDAKEV